MTSILKEKVKILIVDDDEPSNETLKLLLEDILSQNYEISSTFRGDVALEQIEKNNYDIIFLDNKLPVISGLDILKEMKKKKIQSNVIFLTGYSDEQLAVRAMKLGAVDYISKGKLDVDRLLEAINEIILDSCSVLDIPQDILSEIQKMFSKSDTISATQIIDIKYDQNESYIEGLIDALNVLYKNNYIKREKIFSAAGCPNCNSIPDEVYLVCPICKSFDLIKGEVIEHNKCHHIDFKYHFVDSSGNFVCPKCGEPLKQLGVDYIKIGINYSCENGHIFPYPEHHYKCKGCREYYSEEEAKLVDVYKYYLVEEGKTSLAICESLNKLDYLGEIEEVTPHLS